jgi:glutathione S-transferase
MPELLSLPYSPWSEKARFALDVRRVPYTVRVYQPLLGEAALRAKVRRWTGVVTVPVLTTDDGRVLSDSADIARWADDQGEGPQLFPPGHDAAIARFIDLSERGLAAGRALSLTRVLADDEALLELLPRRLRRVLGSGGRYVSGAAIRRTLRKYNAAGQDGQSHRRSMEEVLEAIRAALGGPPASGAPRSLLSTFTFADIAASQVLAFVEPPAAGLKLLPANRRCFGDAALRAQFGDLVAWRDELYSAYRSAGAAIPRRRVDAS